MTSTAMSAAGDRGQRSARTNAPRLADLAGTPESPRTPLLRSFSSTFGSPGAGFRTEDDYVVIEVGSRFVRGGFPGESSPRCTISSGPDEQRRVGDYRNWYPEHGNTRRIPNKAQPWGHDYELWPMDLSNVNLGLVGDRFERAIREMYSKFLLLDTKPRKILLALPPCMPHALMSVLLDVLFSTVQAPSITLMSNPVLATIAAGLRSALVVDIGWAETLVTAVCEYREVQEKRTIRAGKMLSQEMAKLLNAELDNDAQPGAPKADISFEEAQQVLTRVAWCKPHPKSNRRTLYFPAREAPVLEEFEDAVESPPPIIVIPFPKHVPSSNLKVPFASLAKPAEITLFAADSSIHEFDDEDLPIHQLIYRTLVALPVDSRRLCMARIVITGGVSQLPGLKTRILKELEALVQMRGWDPVKSYGKAGARHEEKLRYQKDEWELHREKVRQKILSTQNDSTILPVGFQDPEEDPIDRKLESLSLRNGNPPECSVGGTIRGIETLGVWAGASLLAQQRIKGIVEIEREKYLKDGLTGASREKEVSVIHQRQSMGPGVALKGSERASWTLGVWA